MTTPVAPISLSDVNVEIGRSATAYIDMNESPVRALAGRGAPNSQIPLSFCAGQTYTPNISLLTQNYFPGSSAPSPVNANYWRYKICVIYSWTELTNAGWYGTQRITKIGLYVNSVPLISPFPNWTIGLINTTDPVGTDITSGWTTVRNPVSQSFSTGLYIFTLDTPFIWEGGYSYNNLGVGFVWGSTGSLSNSGTVAYNFTGDTRWAGTYTAGTYALTDSAPNTQVGRPLIVFYND
jgi:hypothetical protein